LIEQILLRAGQRLDLAVLEDAQRSHQRRRLCRGALRTASCETQS
jgi:hypothetical protein